jgi:chitinase
VTIRQLSIDPAYQTTGQANQISLQSGGDTCTNTSLIASGTCTFGVVIQGATQSSQFTVSPKVCANHGQVCSTTTANNRVTVNVDQAVNTPYAYFTLSHCH